MRDKDLYSQILGIQSPWQMKVVELESEATTVKVHVGQQAGIQLTCPKCGAACAGYDKRKRQWRHLDTCQYKTILIADGPRVKCEQHGELLKGETGFFESAINARDGAYADIAEFQRRAGRSIQDKLSRS